MSEQISQADFTPVVQAVFDDLDMQQLTAFRRLSGARRIQQAFDLCDWAQSLIIASIRSRYPDISDAELRERLRSRVSRRHVLWHIGNIETLPAR